MATQTAKASRHWTLGMGAWFLLSAFAAIPAWAAIYVHQNWSDNSYFEMANHTHWHFAVGMICVLVLDTLLRWWCGWRFPIVTRLLHLAILWIPTVYLSSVAEPWTAIPIAQFQKTQKPSKTLSLACWNLFIQNNEFDTIRKTIESLDADVVLLIEVTPEHRKGLDKLAKSYPHSYWAPRTNTQGLAILSRVPGIKFRELVMGKSQMLTLEASLPAGNYTDTPMRLLGVHPASPNKEARFRIRDEQLADITQWVNQSSDEKIIIGDLNTTPWSNGFRSLLDKTGLIDTRRYRGFFATWPCGLGVLGIPIDHALVSKGIEVIDRECGFSTVDSDHQWIRTTIASPKADRSPQVSRDDNDKSSTGL